MNNGLCPECGHDVLVLHGDDGCHMIIDESWDGEDESVFYCDCELTPCEIELMFERDEARKLAARHVFKEVEAGRFVGPGAIIRAIVLRYLLTQANSRRESP